MLKHIKQYLDRGLEWITVLVMGILVVDVVWQVITRFALNNPSNWTEELATYLMIWVGLLGAAVALRRRAHLGIDFFTLKLDERKRLFSEIFCFTLRNRFFRFGTVDRRHSTGYTHLSTGADCPGNRHQPGICISLRTDLGIFSHDVWYRISD